VVATVATVVVLIAGAPVAQASHCSFNDPNQPQKEEIFQGGNYSQRGTTNKIRFRFRQTCTFSHSDPGRGLSWSTAHIRLGNDFDSLVEIGWWMFYLESGQLDRRAFTELVINGVQKAANNWHQTPSSCMNATESDVWRVEWTQYETWSMSINCIDGVGYRQLALYGNTGWTYGLTVGETGRRGGTTTHMADEHRNLLRKLSDGSWTAWTTNFCYHDFADDWAPRFITSDGYNVDWGSGYCDPF